MGERSRERHQIHNVRKPLLNRIMQRESENTGPAVHMWRWTEVSKRDILSCIHTASQNRRPVLFFSSHRSRSSGTRRTMCQISTPGLSLFLNTGIRTRGTAQAHLMRSAAETTLFAQISVTVCAVGVAFLLLFPKFNLLSQLEGEKTDLFLPLLMKSSSFAALL